jgi:predicted GNAT family acetyltransferase
VGEGVVRLDEASSRYEYLVDGHRLGVAEFRTTSAGLMMHHTEVDPARRGQGIGAALVRGALDDVRARGLRVVPTCWYVAQFIDEHPAYRDLLVEPA